LSAGRATKDIIKRSVKYGAATVGNFAPKRSGCSRILTYHSIGHRTHEMNVLPEEFHSQMAWLSKNRPIISLAQAAEGVEGVAVTFDDGYRDNWMNAAPVLQRYNIPATVFIVAGGMGKMLPHDDDPATGALMTWDEVKRLQEAGVEIGAHTLTHVRLSEVEEKGQRREIGGCARRIRKRLGEYPVSFAYPYGSVLDYNELSKLLLEEFGFQYAVTNRYGVNYPDCDPLELRRIWVDATDTLDSFQDKVTGRLDPLAVLDAKPAAHARRLLNRLLRTE
jgi:peptidoglycan/xylan/chitin deacetylase (PgdA/CDA1 family)